MQHLRLYMRCEAYLHICPALCFNVINLRRLQSRDCELIESQRTTSQIPSSKQVSMGSRAYNLSYRAPDQVFSVQALSMGIHESQSLLWERMVGLSTQFAHYLLPKLTAAFPQLPKDLKPEQVAIFLPWTRFSHRLTGSWRASQNTG